jgi:hypothetical protein
MPIQLGVISRTGEAGNCRKNGFLVRVALGDPYKAGTEGLRGGGGVLRSRGRGRFGAEYDISRRDNIMHPNVYIGKTKPPDGESGESERKIIIYHRLITQPNQPSPKHPTHCAHVKERTRKPLRRPPDLFHVRPIRCKNCAKIPSPTCRPNNMSPLASQLFSVVLR